MKYFDESARSIIDGWTALKNADGPAERPNSYFKRNIYRLIKAYVDAGRTAVFIKMAQRSGRSLVGMEAIRDNPFKLALFAMWDDNESLTRNQQRVFGTQMMYAHKHGVPPEHLLGFICIAGSAQAIANKLKDGLREPGFEVPKPFMPGTPGPVSPAPAVGRSVRSGRVRGSRHATPKG
jgi:hypothetical protein